MALSDDIKELDDYEHAYMSSGETLRIWQAYRIYRSLKPTNVKDIFTLLDSLLYIEEIELSEENVKEAYKLFADRV